MLLKSAERVAITLATVVLAACGVKAGSPPSSSLASTASSAPAPASQPAPGAAWDADVFIDGSTVTLTTTDRAAVLARAVDDESAPLRLLAAGSDVTGRWVRGPIDGGRWFKLDGGGYLTSGSLDVNPPAHAAPPVAISFSNADFSFGRELDATLGAARVAADPADPKMIGFGMTMHPIAHRRWLGLTVIGVATGSESNGLVFINSAADIRRAMAGAGIRFDGNSVIATAPDEEETCTLSDLPIQTFAVENPEANGLLDCGL